MSSGRRVCMIRAVNVGTTGQLPMEDLRTIAEGLGATEVSTYIRSGNLLCVPPGDPADFDRAVEAAIEQRFGFVREVVSRSREEMLRALADYPFDVPEPKFAYINFLLAAPTAEAVQAARAYETADDRWAVGGRDQYVSYANGAGRPQMNVTAISRALGVAGTARNLLTVQKLVELAGE